MTDVQNGYTIPENTQEKLRTELSSILEVLRAEQKAAGMSSVGRAVSIAVTDFEKVSMVIIRSFFANEPYSPLQKLRPAEPQV